MQEKATSLSAKTFESQQSITELEKKRFLFGIRPRFIVDVKPWEQREDGYHLQVYIQLKENVASNIVMLDESYEIIADSDIQYFGVDETIRVYNGPWPNNGFKIDKIIQYEDELGNEYYQNIIGDVRTLQISPPILIE